MRSPVQKKYAAKAAQGARGEQRAGRSLPYSITHETPALQYIGQKAFEFLADTP